MLKLTIKEKQALKELDKNKNFKSWRKEIIIWIFLLVLVFVFFWKHSQILLAFVTIISSVIALRYSLLLKSSKATYSISKKIEKEYKRQQEQNKKIFLPLIAIMVGAFILFMIGLIIKILLWK